MLMSIDSEYDIYISESVLEPRLLLTLDLKSVNRQTK